MSTSLARVEPTQGAVSAIARMAPAQLNVIKNTVAKGASDDELAMFLELANRYQLDPFAREIWCVKMGSGMTITTSRDGYLAIANRHPAYEGMESDVVREGDTFQRTPAGIEHTYGAKRGAILGAYACVYRSDRQRPGYFYAPFAEYSAGNGPTWRTYPSAMIIKVAESMALKRAFSISGLVTQEEMDADREPTPHPIASVEQPSVDLPDLSEVAGYAERYAALSLHIHAQGLVPNDVWAAAGITAQKDLDDNEKYALARTAVGDTPDDGDVVEGDVVDETSDEPVYITESQRKRLFAIAREVGATDAWVKSVVLDLTGQDSRSKIPPDKYEAVIDAIQAGPAAEHVAAGGEALFPADPPRPDGDFR